MDSTYLLEQMEAQPHERSVGMVADCRSRQHDGDPGDVRAAHPGVGVGELVAVVVTAAAVGTLGALAWWLAAHVGALNWG